MSFTILGKLYPNLYSRRNKAKLVCYAYKFVEHTRATYPSFVNRSFSCFDIYFSIWLEMVCHFY
jgi:hypothetical protein